MERRLILEAAAWLAVVRAGLAVASAPTIWRLLERVSARFPRRAADEDAPAIARALARARRHLPGAGTCLIEALAAWAMLVRRGHAAEIRFGVRRPSDPTRPLDAHAWVECAGVIVVGEAEDGTAYQPLQPA